MSVALLDTTGTANAWQAGGQSSPVLYTSGVNNNNTSVNISGGATACFLSAFFSGLTTPGTITASWSGPGTPSLTQIGSTLVGAGSSMAVFGIVNPPAQTGGTFTVSWTGGASRICIAHVTLTGTVTSSVAAAFANVTTTNTGTAGAPSVSVTTAAGDGAIMIGADDSNNATGMTAGGSATLLYSGTAGRASGSEFLPASAGSTAMSMGWAASTSTAALVLGFDIVQSGAIVPPPIVAAKLVMM